MAKGEPPRSKLSGVDCQHRCQTFSVGQHSVAKLPLSLEGTSAGGRNITMTGTVLMAGRCIAAMRCILQRQDTMHNANGKQLCLKALQQVPGRAGTPCIYCYYYYYKRLWCYLGVAVQTPSRAHMHISGQEAESDTLGRCNLLTPLNQHLTLLQTRTDRCIVYAKTKEEACEPLTIFCLC